MSDESNNTANIPIQPIDVLGDPPALTSQPASALERLGPSPFPRSGFPFLGFLATVYDHVASQVKQSTCKR